MEPRPDVNWTQVCKRLGIISTFLTRSLPSVFDGISAEDLASEVVLQFFESDTKLGWDGKRDLVTFLGGVLKHRFLDHLRRAQIAAGAIQQVSPDQHTGSEARLVSEAVVGSIRSRVLSDPHLSRFVEAAISDDFDGGHNQNQQLASLMGTSPAEIVNLRRRLVRHLKSQRSAASGREAIV